MSHTINKQAGFVEIFPLQLTIANYAVGGEAVTAAELGCLGVNGVILGQVPPGQNSLAVPLFPILSGGKIMLFRFVSGAPVEIAATTALNAVVTAIVFVTAWS